VVVVHDVHALMAVDVVVAHVPLVLVAVVDVAHALPLPDDIGQVRCHDPLAHGDATARDALAAAAHVDAALAAPAVAAPHVVALAAVVIAADAPHVVALAVTVAALATHGPVVPPANVAMPDVPPAPTVALVLGWVGPLSHSHMAPATALPHAQATPMSRPSSLLLPMPTNS
jgi:hypothetical protein